MEQKDLPKEMHDALPNILTFCHPALTHYIEGALEDANTVEEFRDNLDHKMNELANEALGAFKELFPDAKSVHDEEPEEPETIRIAIDLDGGRITNVYSKTPVEAIVLDTDLEGIGKDELIELYGEEVYVTIRAATIKPKIIDVAFRLFEEGEKANQK